MIYKKERYGYKGHFDLYITDKNNNTFRMTVAGNQDLYWMPEDYKITNFCIDKSDEFLYEIFEYLFWQLERNDNEFYPSIQDNVFTFASEDRPLDDADMLQIEKKENEFEIRFLKNKSDSIMFKSKFCNICFCNSGSRVPKLEQQVMILFNELAYYTPEMPLEKE